MHQFGQSVRGRPCTPAYRLSEKGRSRGASEEIDLALRRLRCPFLVHSLYLLQIVKTRLILRLARASRDLVQIWVRETGLPRATGRLARHFHRLIVVR
jgi:hypothetical protein